MVRGTTPTLTFTLPFDVAELTTAWITLAQNGVTKIDKPLEECTADGNTISVRLSQQETLSLSSRFDTEIQVAVKIGETVLRSQIITVDTGRILKEGEI